MSSNIVPLWGGRDRAFNQREQRIIDTLACHDRLLVSFSGRMESCYAMELCRIAGVQIHAITIDNPTSSRREISRTRKYCEYHQIAHTLVQSEEMIFFYRDGLLANSPDPIRWLTHYRDGASALADLPLMVGGSVEDLAVYRLRFGALPTNTLWTFADEGMTTRDIRYGFHQRQLAVWGNNEPGCLSLRFSRSQDVDGHKLRMVDMAEHMLSGLGLPNARVFFHYLSDGETMLCRVRLPQSERAMAFDRQQEVLGALQACGFDLVTLNLHQIDDSTDLP